MKNKHLVVLCTVPDAETGKKISHTLVKEKLAACCNIVPDLTSVYQWKDQVESEGESLVIIKTRAEIFEKLEHRILALHPYEVPEIIALPLTVGTQEYLKWIDENVEK